MLTEHTLTQLRGLRLDGMLHALQGRQPGRAVAWPRIETAQTLVGGDQAGQTAGGGMVGVHSTLVA